MLISDKCYICGSEKGFQADENMTLLREAKCCNCGTSIRNSDVAHMIVKYSGGGDKCLKDSLDLLKDKRILNLCSSGYIHNSLNKLGMYTPSEFFDDVKSGEYKDGILCVDLCQVPFEDNSFDLVISEDVLEHVAEAEKAFSEINRVLKPQGLHIFTVPIHENRETRSRLGNSKKVYHGDPIRQEGTLVCTDFGNDIEEYIEKVAGKSRRWDLHRFYEPNEVTDADETYEEYQEKKECLDTYFKYNSIVIVTHKKLSEIEEFSGERFVPGIEDEKLTIEHMQRYQSVLPLVRGKKVVDIACGEGYGTEIISREAKEVIGIDIDEGAVDRASNKYQKSNLKYQVGNIASIPLQDHSVDIIVSFETIEHVNEELQKEFMNETRRVLKNDGILIISTPNKEVYSDRYHYFNEFHIKEFYHDEFIAFLNRNFKYVKMYNQAFEVASILSCCEGGEESVAYFGEEEYSSEGKYYLAIASNEKINVPNISSVVMNNPGEYDKNIQRIVTLQKEEEERNLHIRKLDMEIQKNGEIIRALQKEEQDYNNQISYLNSVVEKKDSDLEEFEKKLKSREADIADLKQVLNNKEADIADLKQVLNNKEADTADLKQMLNNKEGHIEQLLEVERAYEREKNTRTYRLAKKFQKIAAFLLPPNSKRRFVLRVMCNLMRHPKLMIHVINPKRIHNYFKYLKKEGIEGVNKRYDEAVSLEKMRIDPGSKLDINIVNQSEHKENKPVKIEDYETILFETFEKPTVSILIPVYNEFDYTYNCLKSIKRNSGDVAYEVIIANDCSTDITGEIEKVAKNIRLITTETNVRFLLNCNNAARYAKGKYILFLNNDTQVQPNWLKPLVTLIESNPQVGMVGSKLVYADGRLQEAGGILWRDGSAWNYGNRQDADSSEFNYVKEADYISGAAIMIKTSLWKEIGGFDERFVPAYCEDSDLAFEVRRHGYKVLYQPLSVVVHFEGVSNGTDITSGQKNYQVVNQKKFMEKWQDVLEKDHYPNAENVFVARDRSKDKPMLLMVDHYVPQYDKDAGSRTVYQYLKLFVEQGFNVKFIGDNFYKHEPYTTELQQMGIEVLYGPYYAKHWKEWISENAQFIQYVFLNRPHISVKYIDYIRNKTNARIIYYGHDLHFLREMRNYELTGDESALESSDEWKKKELQLMHKADVVYYPSSIEVEEISKIDSDIKAKAIVAYMFPNVVSERYNFDERKDIMFVGGFTHTPNVDAVLWFVKEVFPQIQRTIPNMKLYIIGSNPTEEVCNLGTESVIVKGFVSDEELECFYKTCRISVVPLRYGAGIKGKVVEAMRYGIPVVTTSVGAEGIIGAEKILCVEDDPQKLGEKLCALYDDKEALIEMSNSSYDYIRNNFSEYNAWNVIKEDFDS